MADICNLQLSRPILWFGFLKTTGRQTSFPKPLSSTHQKRHRFVNYTLYAISQIPSLVSENPLRDVSAKYSLSIVLTLRDAAIPRDPSQSRHVYNTPDALVMEVFIKATMIDRFLALIYKKTKSIVPSICSVSNNMISNKIIDVYCIQRRGTATNQAERIPFFKMKRLFR